MDLDAIREFHHRRDILGEQDRCRCGQKMPCDGVMLLAALDLATARAAGLEAALKRHGQHDWNCGYLTANSGAGAEDSDVVCICGLLAALAPETLNG